MYSFSDPQFLKSYLGYLLAPLLSGAIIGLAFAPLYSGAEDERTRERETRTGEAVATTIISERVNLTRTEIVNDCCDDDEGGVMITNNNSVFISNSASAVSNTGGNGPKKDEKKDEKKFKKIRLKELGLLQLAAHDFFNVDRDAEVDHENGKLDLSTLLDHGEENIAIGGEDRNRENIFLFTVSKQYGELYIKYRDKYGEEKAYKKIVKKYHKELKKVYEDIFDEDFPKKKSGEATMTENLALRTIHDLLPGHIIVDGVEIVTVDPSLVGETLSRKELNQRSGPLDGIIDQVFRDITIVIPPSTILNIDLHERDSSFANQFNTDFSFEHFMSELEDGSYDEDEDVMEHIRELFAKGLYF